MTDEVLVTDEVLANDPLLHFPGSLSPSRTNDFLTCPLLFRFRSIDRIPELSSAAALRGTLVHTTLEKLFDLPAGDRNVAQARVLLTAAWIALSDEDPDSAGVLRNELGLDADRGPADIAEQILVKVLPLLDTYFALEDPKRLEPHAREFAVSADIAEQFTIRGFVDRIDRTPGGDIRIVDYKTGKAPGARFEAKAMFQMRFYALAWWRMTGDIPRLLQLMYLGSSDILKYEPNEADLLATESKILAVRSAINEAARSGTFAPTTSKLCDWCAHRALCPAWGGVLPELPDIATWISQTSRVPLVSDAAQPPVAVATAEQSST